MASQPSNNALTKLSLLRGEIDRIDSAIIHLLFERFTCSDDIGDLKANEDMPKEDLLREREVKERLAAKAARIGVDPEFVRDLFTDIMSQSKKRYK